MPFIKQQIQSKTITVSIKLPDTLVKEIEHYCRYADIENINHYLQQAAVYVLEKDKAFVAWKKNDLAEKSIQQASNFPT